MAEKVATHCVEKGVAGRAVTLKVKYDDFEQITRQRSVAAPIDGSADMLSLARDLLAELQPIVKPIRLLGLSVSGLGEPEPILQLDLFENDF